MQAVWNIQVEKPRFAISRLASLQAESPQNSQTVDEIGVLVALWCGRESISVCIEETTERFNVGFTVGDLEVLVRNGRISTQNRFKQEFYREKIDQNVKDTSSKEGKVGGLFGLELPKLFSGTKLSVEGGANASKGSAVIEEKKGEYYRVYWRIADAGYNRWKCFGYGLNADNVLENKIIGDDILCFVIPDDNSDNVEIIIRYYVDQQDLWFAHQHESAMLAVSFNKLHRNREAVASAIVSRALNRASRTVEGESGRRLVLLCQQRIIARRSSGEGDE